MTRPFPSIPALVCDLESDQCQPVVIAYDNSTTDALCALARLASNFSPRECAIVLWLDGLANDPIVVADDRMGWARVHPDAWDVPKWPGLDLGEEE